MADDKDSEEIELVAGRLVEIDFVMTNLTGIPDEQFTPLGDLWEDDVRILPDESEGLPAPPVPPVVPPAPKSV
jgi:hypothetical protein